jgi:hypothetical protein
MLVGQSWANIYAVLCTLNWTYRYGAIKGATTEFNKWEGITLDKKTMTLHWAISTVANGN